MEAKCFESGGNQNRYIAQKLNLIIKLNKAYQCEGSCTKMCFNANWQDRCQYFIHKRNILLFISFNKESIITKLYFHPNFTVAFLNPKELSPNIFWIKNLSLNLKLIRIKIYISVYLKQNESVLLKLLNILSNLGRKQYNQRLFELCKNFVKDELQIFISITEITEMLHFSLVSESFVV